MTSEFIHSHSLTKTLASYLEGLEETGIASVELEQPFPSSPQATPPSRPRQQPAQIPPPEKPVEKAILPSPPAPEPLAVPQEKKLVWCTLIRRAECLDDGDATESAVVLVTNAEETTGEHGDLLAQILQAAGYEILNKPLALTHPEDLKGAGERILVMGNPALQRMSPAGMELKIVRGMWQATPYGKLISTFPPSVLPDNPAGKKAVWQDLKALLKELSLKVPESTLKKISAKK